MILEINLILIIVLALALRSPIDLNSSLNL